MRTKRLSSVVAMAAVCLVGAGPTWAQEQDEESREERVVRLRQDRLSGPRLGMVYVVHGSDWDQKLDDHGIDNFISQFGWHFEWLVRPQGGGPAFVTELMPLLGGVEYGTVIPSLSLVFGIRFPRGFELGMGPQVVATFEKPEPVNTSLVVGIGQYLDFSGVKIPLNLAVSTNGDGQRVAFVFGYAIRSRRNA